MKRNIFFILFFLTIFYSMAYAQEELLGKSQAEVMKMIADKKYELTTPNCCAKVEILIKSGITKWKTNAYETIRIDTAGFVDHVSYLLGVAPGDTDSVIGMTFTNRVNALIEMTKKYGEPKIVNPEGDAIYTWEDSKALYQFIGLNPTDMNNTRCFYECIRKR